MTIQTQSSIPEQPEMITEENRVEPEKDTITSPKSPRPQKIRGSILLSQKR